MHEPTHDQDARDQDRPGRHERTGHEEQAERTTDKVLHVHPDEATGEIDPHDDDRTDQTPHGLTQKDDETTR